MNITSIEERYRAMSPEEFGYVKRDDLTADTVRIYDREVARRQSLGYRMPDAAHQPEGRTRWGVRAFAVLATLFVVMALVGIADKSKRVPPKAGKRLEDNPENVIAAGEISNMGFPVSLAAAAVTASVPAAERLGMTTESFSLRLASIARVGGGATDRELSTVGLDSEDLAKIMAVRADRVQRVLQYEKPEDALYALTAALKAKYPSNR